MVKNSNVRVMVTLSKELDDRLNELVEISKKANRPVTKSQVTEVALRAFINQLIEAKEK